LLLARSSNSLTDFTGSLFDAVTRSGERAIKATGVKSLIVSNGMFFFIAGLIVKVGDTRRSVYPSGGAMATAEVPIMPPAPERFSTTTG
jgi:hypothetical protein